MIDELNLLADMSVDLKVCDAVEALLNITDTMFPPGIFIYICLHLFLSHLPTPPFSF